MHLDDTIVAIATPAGRGGIGVVRLSGPRARQIATPMLRLAHDLQPNRAHFGELIDPATGERIDEIVATYFVKPHSYTTDDVLEISCHGSPVVLRHAVEIALSRGARLAQPGEFTMRAFLNGRLDLTQAEAVRDLIESQTLYQAQVAARQLEGALSKRLQPVKQKLVQLIATLEAGVDFAEDDISVLPDERILGQIAGIRQPLNELLDSFVFGKVVHEGLTLAIIGRPNVGKSSLFNRLVERDRAIVTATPGTTRDLVTETVAIGGIPVRLVDTAGIRPATDEAENIGVQKSMETLAEADVVLLVVEAGGESAANLRQDMDLFNRTDGRRRIVAVNKIDLVATDPSTDLATLRSHARGHEHAVARLAEVAVFSSATTGEGIDDLRSAIMKLVHGGCSPEQESGFLTNVRHQKLVQDSLAALEAAAAAVPQRIPHEMLLLDLYNALRPLDEITGATTADDILNVIFSSFCIGK